MKFGFFGKKEEKPAVPATPAIQETQAGEPVLTLDRIKLGCETVDKETAIRAVGQLLVDAGCVDAGYVEAMLDREKVLTTYIGEGVAIPHGVGTARDLIRKSGICVMQYPQGVVFGEGKVARLVVGIAGKGGEHMDILSNLAEIIMEKEIITKLFETDNAQDIHSAFVGKL